MPSETKKEPVDRTDAASRASAETARRDASAPATAPGSGQAPAAGTSTSGEVADFLRRMKSIAPTTTAGRGRLVFAMDATMSRQPTWDMALALQ